MKIFGILTFIFLLSTNSFAHKSIVDSYYKNAENCQQISHWFYFCGSDEHLERVLSWMDDLRTYEIGNETISSIENSNKKMLIMHKSYAVISAGKTLAPAVGDLSNGNGVDVVVQMNFDMPETGSHRVAGKTQHLIPFTAIQNFFHELSHARHKTNGTFWMSAGEKQAIIDENIFRTEEAVRNGEKILERSYHGYGEDDIQIWFGVDNEKNSSLPNS